MIRVHLLFGMESIGSSALDETQSYICLTRPMLLLATTVGQRYARYNRACAEERYLLQCGKTALASGEGFIAPRELC